MIVVADKSFYKMLKKLSYEVRKDVIECIERLQNEPDFTKFDIKKKKGYKSL